MTATIQGACDANITLLINLSHLVSLLDDEQYNWCYRDHRSSVGRHVRHIADHYDSFFRDLPAGNICYDNRSRDTEVETSRDTASANITRIIEVMQCIAAESGKSLSLSVLPAANCRPLHLRSTIGRELMFLHGHTLHHMAIVQLLAEMQGLDLGATFANAPSTEQHSQPQIQAGTRS